MGNFCDTMHYNSQSYGASRALPLVSTQEIANQKRDKVRKSAIERVLTRFRTRTANAKKIHDICIYFIFYASLI
jgi:hypothetical protein